MLRGWLELREQIRRGPGSTLTLACRFEDYTADLPHNQVIRYTLRHISTTGRKRLDQRLRKLRIALAPVSPRRFRAADFDRFVYDRLVAHDQPIHGLCRLILDARGAEEDTGALPMGSSLVDMNTLPLPPPSPAANTLHTDGIDLAHPWPQVETSMHALMHRLLALADEHACGDYGRVAGTTLR